MSRRPLESSIERRVVEALEADGAVVLKMGYEGYPDRLVLIGDGEHYWIEFKRPGGGLRTAQLRRIVKLRRMGEKVEIIGLED